MPYCSVDDLQESGLESKQIRMCICVIKWFKEKQKLYLNEGKKNEPFDVKNLFLLKKKSNSNKICSVQNYEIDKIKTNLADVTKYNKNWHKKKKQKGTRSTIFN